jgi:hypothetical protein
VVEISVYSSLRAYYPDKPFYPFRDPNIFALCETHHLTEESASFYGFKDELAHLVDTFDPRVSAMLALIYECLQDKDNLNKYVVHLLYEVMYQYSLTLINIIQYPDASTRPFLIPNVHVRFTTDVLPELPLSSFGSYLTEIKNKVNGIRIPDVMHTLMWKLVAKNFPRGYMIRNIIDKMSEKKTFSHTVLVDLLLDVTFLYGFLGAYSSAKVRLSMLTALAVIQTFQHFPKLNYTQYHSFVFNYFHIIFFSWAMYSIDHVRNAPILDSLLNLYSNRKSYVECIIRNLDQCRTILNKHIEPVAIKIIPRRAST